MKHRIVKAAAEQAAKEALEGLMQIVEERAARDELIKAQCVSLSARLDQIEAAQRESSAWNAIVHSVGTGT